MAIVVIEAYERTAPVDEGTVFWTQSKQPLGKVFEIFGPVKKPYYSIRVPEPATAIKPGTEAFIITESSDMTHYIFTDPLLREKGSDASWLDDKESPVSESADQFREFSDDEQEQEYRRQRRGQTNMNTKKKKPTSTIAGRGRSTRDCRPVMQNYQLNIGQEIPGSATLPYTSTPAYQELPPPLVGYQSLYPPPPPSHWYPPPQQQWGTPSNYYPEWSPSSNYYPQWGSSPHQGSGQ